MTFNKKSVIHLIDVIQMRLRQTEAFCLGNNLRTKWMPIHRNPNLLGRKGEGGKREEGGTG